MYLCYYLSIDMSDLVPELCLNYDLSYVSVSECRSA